MFNLDDDMRKIIMCILGNHKVHYRDLIRATGLSRVTVSRRLDNIERWLKQYKVQLMRKRGDGIYLEGNLSSLLKRLRQNRQDDSSQRVTNIYLLLLTSDKAITVQTMADLFFVSHSTMQKYVQDARVLAQHDGLQLKTTNHGLMITSNEIKRRRGIRRQLRHYWHGQFSVNPLIKQHANVFNTNFLDQIKDICRSFLDDKAIHYNEYQLNDMVLHIAVADLRMQTHDFLPDKHEPVLSQTKELSHQLEIKLNLSLPEREQVYLNRHLLALTGKDSVSRQAIKQWLSPILQNEFRYQPDEWLLNDLSTHLTSTIKRMRNGLDVHNSLAGQIRDRFPYSFDKAVDLSQKVEAHFKIKLPVDEIAFIALHLQNFVDRHARAKGINCILLCVDGIGMSRFLEQRIDEVYHDQLNVIQVMSLSEFDAAQIQVPLVISTVDVPELYDLDNTKVVVVNPLLEKEDIRRISAIIATLNKDEGMDALQNLLLPQYIWVRRNLTTTDAVIRFIGRQLQRNSLAKKGVIQDALDREKIASTRLNDVAIPHAKIQYIRKPVIAFLMNPEGINWHDGTVYLVIFIGLNQSVNGQMHQIYQELYQLISPSFVEHARLCKNKTELYQNIINRLERRNQNGSNN